jgi:flagellar motility protein MotE (MotC chaperone)
VTGAPARQNVKLAPVLVVALLALGGLKAAGLWVSVAGAQAAQTPAAPNIVAGSAPVSDRLAVHLAARGAALDARAAELDTRERVLEAAEARIDAAAKALATEKQSIALATSGRARLRDDELSALSSAYERMKARDAARIFEILDDDILLPVAAGMRTQALAGVLAEMSAERAKALTVALANREGPAPPATGGR